MPTRTYDGNLARKYAGLADSRFRAQPKGDFSKTEKLPSDGVLRMSRRGAIENISVTCDLRDIFMFSVDSDGMYRFRDGCIFSGDFRNDASTGTLFGTPALAHEHMVPMGKYVIAIIRASDYGVVNSDYVVCAVRIIDPMLKLFYEPFGLYAAINVVGDPYISVAPLGEDDDGVMWASVCSVGWNSATNESVKYVYKFKVNMEPQDATLLFPASPYKVSGSDCIVNAGRGKLAWLGMDYSGGDTHPPCNFYSMDVFGLTAFSYPLNSLPELGLVDGGYLFVNPYSGIVHTGGDNFIFSIRISNASMAFYRTTDGGYTWARIYPTYLDFTTVSAFGDKTFTSLKEGHAGFFTYNTGNTINKHVFTFDHGATWGSVDIDMTTTYPPPSGMCAHLFLHQVICYRSEGGTLFYVGLDIAPESTPIDANGRLIRQEYLRVFSDPILTNYVYSVRVGEGDYELPGIDSQPDPTAVYFHPLSPLREGYPGLLEKPK